MELISPGRDQAAESSAHRRGDSQANFPSCSVAGPALRRLVLGVCLGAVYYDLAGLCVRSPAAVLVHALGDALSGHSDERQNFMPPTSPVTSTAVVASRHEKMKTQDQEKEQTMTGRSRSACRRLEVNVAEGHGNPGNRLSHQRTKSAPSPL